jgi:hypothetical protein
MPPIQHPTVPKEYAGKWIAWDHSMSRIAASGATPAEVLEAAKKADEPDPVLGKSPPANVRLIGAGPLCVQKQTAKFGSVSSRI